jgi:hypothetical protein
MTRDNLQWDVFVTPGIPIVTRDKPPGIRETFFQATASTLIYGVRDAVLVDAFMTVTQANALADWGLEGGIPWTDSGQAGDRGRAQGQCHRSRRA